MTEDGHTGVEPQLLVDPLADLNRAARALGHDDHEVRVAGQARLADPVDDVPVKIDRLFPAPEQPSRP